MQLVLTCRQNYIPGLPVVSFRFSEEYRRENPDVQQKWVQTLLRSKGWIVPNYELAPDLQDVEILRVVVRESVTADMIDRLVADLVSIVLYVLKMCMLIRSCCRLRPSKSWPRRTRLSTL